MSQNSVFETESPCNNWPSWDVFLLIQSNPFDEILHDGLDR
jgi:hypothetical protein